MDNILGRRIKFLREDKKLSQLDFAKIINVGNTTLSQYENGQRTPSDGIKQKIADYFGVSIDYLLGRENSFSNPKNKDITETYHKVDISNLTEEDVEYIEAMINGIKERRKNIKGKNKDI